MAFIKLNKQNFFHNLDIICEKTGSLHKIALVLKDNAYGHGLREIAQLAQEYGVTKAVVRSDEEAQKIEEYFEYILVLCEIPKVASKKRNYTINDIQDIKNFPKNTKVELKVNTGMNRNGIEMHELDKALQEIQTQNLHLEAIFTHHGCADEVNGLYEIQKNNFERVKAKAPQGLRFHSCNSAALFREENFNEDMVRVGISAYGCLEMPQEFMQVKFKAVLSLYAQRISSRIVQKGGSVGYGATFTAQVICAVSNYDFGYGDGFMRNLSQIYTTPQGIKIAGRISMDNSSFVSKKEELLIFNDAKEVAKMANTISYEVLTSLKADIPRKFV